MTLKLTNFEVSNLHRRRSIHLNISDNKIVLVGENGTGKTTIINLLYYFLSRQWNRLNNYTFDAIRAEINDSELVITKEMLTVTSTSKKTARFFTGPRYADARRLLLGHLSKTGEVNLAQLSEYADKAGIPATQVYELLSRISGNELALNEAQQQLSNTLSELVQEQILYLPTYRRIEQDLKSIFPNSSDRTLKGRLVNRNSEKGFIELIEFGMEDVETDISKKMNQLKENARSGLNNLTTSYLRDVISGEYQFINADSIEPVELQTIESVFNRIDERTLPQTAKTHLREIVSKIRSEQRVEDEEKVIALFLLKLLELHRNQQSSEKNVRDFVQICNKYLVGKELRYDSDAYTITVHLTSISSNTDDENIIALKSLSSGEKQIVSLFSHLYLSDAQQYFVLIDEPELSLSVPWQMTFLPDILSTNKCTGLIAVTHSPFIFQNSLDKYGHNLSDFWV